jgi:hypothetical protein
MERINMPDLTFALESDTWDVREFLARISGDRGDGWRAEVSPVHTNGSPGSNPGYGEVQ